MNEGTMPETDKITWGDVFMILKFSLCILILKISGALDIDIE